MNSQSLIFKTHVWNKSVEIFCDKLLKETSDSSLDFFILAHDNDKILSRLIPRRFNVLFFHEDEIKHIYTTGYTGNIWLSNHWILMWFYKKTNYQYIWSMEYDVRISGDSRKIWQINDTADFIYPHIYNRGIRYTGFYSYKKGNLIKDDDICTGFVQLCRYSAKFLKILDDYFTAGDNGQDEMMIFSIAVKEKIEMKNEFLYPLTKGFWTWKPKFSNFNSYHYKKLDRTNVLGIFHPVKN